MVTGKEELVDEWIRESKTFFKANISSGEPDNWQETSNGFVL